jgi:cyclic beta-1,2-glucan synthetase
MIQPAAAVRNFARLRAAGAQDRYGFREALDYTSRRLPEGATVAVVKSYMAHHQGMLLVALGNVLNGQLMIGRFHADPMVEATELLLQERMPRDVLVARPRAEEVKSSADPLQRALRRHDHRRRVRLQQVGRHRRDALA